MKKYIFSFLIALPLITQGQSNAISTELFFTGNSYAAIMINFEHLFLQKNRNALGFRVGVGNSVVNNVQFFNAEGLYYRGNVHRLELAPVFTLGERMFSSEGASPLREVSYGLRTGYAYAPKSINLLLRIGFTTYQTNTLQPISLSKFSYLMPYIGVGYRF